MDGDAATTGPRTPARTTIEVLLALGTGLGVGGFLVRAAVPTAIDLLDASGQDPFTAAIHRAFGLALATLAVVIARAPLERLPSALLAGLAAGVGSRLLLDPLDGFVLPPFAWLGLAVASALALTVMERGTDRGRPRQPRAPQAAHLGVTVAAAGITLQLTGLTRIAGRLGLGTPEDNAVFAAAFAVLIAIGGVAFGRIVVRSSVAHVTAAIGAAGIAGLLALPIAAAIATPLGFKSLCARFGADASLAGTLRVDMAVALTVLVLPGLAIGALLHIVRSRSLFVALAFGVAGGTLAAPRLLSRAATSSIADWAGPGSAGLVTAGVLVAGLGLAVVGACAARRWQQRAALAVGGALAGLGALLPVTFVPVLDPWERFPVQPHLIIETVDGQFSIEPAGGGIERVTLDQRPLSPRAAGLAADAARIRASFTFTELRPPGRGVRVLVVGLVTPARARVLEEEGAVLIDRTAGWWRSMDAIEEALFRGAPRPPGSIQEPALARAMMKGGAYDLIIALTPGNRGGLCDMISRSRLVGGEPVVGAPILWLDSERAMAHLDWPEHIALTSDGIENWSIGFDAVDPQLDRLPRRSSAGPASAAPSILEWLAVRPDERARRAWRAAAARIASAADAGPFERALALHAAAQTISSPFESRAHRIELDEEALTLWRDHAVASTSLTPLEKGVIEGLARVIEGKREVPRTYEILEPIAAAHSPWPVLVRTLAWADGEELEFAEAVARLEPLWRSDPADMATARCHALALVEAGRPTDAVAVLRPLSEAAPLDRRLKTQLADALVAAGDPEGRKLATELLRDDPRNPLLFGLARGMRGMDTLSGESPPVDGR